MDIIVDSAELKKVLIDKLKKKDLKQLCGDSIGRVWYYLNHHPPYNDPPSQDEILSLCKELGVTVKVQIYA